MKLYQKKNVSLEDETVLVHLERRHTLKEDTNEADSDNHRKTIRANSLGSLGEDPSVDIEAMATEKQSNFTRRPTVITESELSSSSLYRKAKINSDDEGIEEPKSTEPHKDHEDLEPKTLHDPKLKPVTVSNHHPRKKSSCCWYFSLITVIFIAFLVVVAGVLGIVYMEYFAIYDDNIESTNASEKNDYLPASKESFQHSVNTKENFYPYEPKIPENILKDILKNSAIFSENTDSSRIVALSTSQPNDIFENKDLKTDELNEVKSFVSDNQDIETTKHPQTSDRSGDFRDFLNQFNILISNNSEGIKSNAKNSDSLDLTLNLQSIYDIVNKTVDGFIDNLNEQMMGNERIFTSKLNPEIEEVDSSKESFVSVRNFDEMTALQGIELEAQQVNTDKSLQIFPESHSLPDNSFELMEKLRNDNHEDNSFNHREHGINQDSEDNSFDHGKQDIIHDPEDNFFDHREHDINHNAEDDSFDHRENDDNQDIEDNSFHHEKQATEHDPKVDSHTENSVGRNPENSLDHKQSIDLGDKSLNDLHSDSNDLESDANSEEVSPVHDHNRNSDDEAAQLVFIRPVVESKAVPVPLEFLRRIGLDIKNPNNLQLTTAEDMDVKFSLAEALKYLRSLDTENKLPVAREKTDTQKTSNQKEAKKTKLPVKSEREEYLSLLRKQMFEESL